MKKINISIYALKFLQVWKQYWKIYKYINSKKNLKITLSENLSCSKGAESLPASNELVKSSLLSGKEEENSIFLKDNIISISKCLNTQDAQKLLHLFIVDTKLAAN